MKLCFIVLALCVYGSAGAQTKEETVKWISDKVNAFSFGPKDFFDCQYSNSGESYHFNSVVTMPDSHTEEIFASSHIISDGINDENMWGGDLANLTNAKVCGECTYCGANVPINLYFRSGTVKHGGQGNNTGDMISLYLRWDGEPDLRDRMLKALLHLVELQGTKEAF